MIYSELLTMERDEMLRYKWTESEKAGRDLGDVALLDWARNHDAAFLEYAKNQFGEPSDIAVAVG